MKVVAVFLAGLVTAYAWTIVDPDSGTVWEAGKEARIEWQPTAEDSTLNEANVNVDLMVGPGNGIVVMVLGKNIPAVAGELNWLVSKYLSSRSDYFVRLSNTQSKSTLATSDRFNVVSPDPLGTNTTNNDESAAPSLATGSRTAALISVLLLLLFTR